MWDPSLSSPFLFKPGRDSALTVRRPRIFVMSVIVGLALEGRMYNVRYNWRSRRPSNTFIANISRLFFLV